ncbi:MAG: SurA N-terminal domain-containing protein, partial [Chthonomonadales bacterium]
MRKKIDEEPQYTGDFLSLTRWRKLASHKVWYYVLAGVFGFSLIAYFGPGQYGGGRGASKASPSKDDSSGDVIAIVNDVPVSRVSYENQWSQMQNQMGGALAGQPTMAANFQGSVLSQLVNDAIARSAAKKKNLSVSEADIDKELQKLKESISGPGKPVDEAQFQAMLDARGVTESQVRDDLRESLLPRILADSISNQQKVTEDDVLKSYDEVKVRRIFVGVISPTSAMPGSLPDAQAQRRMEQIQAKIKGGEDFAKAADQYSTDPGNKNSVTDPKTKKSTITLLGGQLNAGQGVQKEDIGWYKRGGGQGDEFDNAAFALKKGEMSGIIKSPAGYNLIKVEDTRRKLPTDYDKKKADYLKQLKESKARKPITDMMEAEKKAAKI